jgi:hypothetical protein
MLYLKCLKLQALSNYFALKMYLWWDISMVFIFKISNIINLACDFCNIPLFKQPKIQPPGILLGPVVCLFLMAILGGWGLDQLRS